MDRRGRSSPGTRPLPAISIPMARRPLQAPPVAVASPLATDAGQAQSEHLRGLIRMAEVAIVVIGVYVLIGLGIGAAAGSLMVGAGAGLIAGVCAIAAILLIRGSALSAG